MSWIDKAKQAAREFKEGFEAEQRERPQPSAADQQLQRDAETVIRNQQMGLTD